MKAPVKLLTLWQGPMPPWFPRWRARIEANAPLVEWEVINMGDVGEVNALASRMLGTPCRKGSAYALGCDIRPFFPAVFPDRVAGHEWWGMVDLDTCVGDLTNLLPPLLEAHDVITTSPTYVHGPLTLFRNSPHVNRLFEREPCWQEVIGDPDYWNFDEDGFGLAANPSLTQLVKAAQADGTLRVRWDDRCWTAGQDTVADGLPSRCCKVDPNGRLVETPTGRELLCYHFSDKRWRWSADWHFDFDSLAGLQENVAFERRHVRAHPPISPDESPEGWRLRLMRTIDQKREIHRVCLDCLLVDWEAIQGHTRQLLAELLRLGDSVLDVGCGYGALVECLPNVFYSGVDWCADMVELAKARNPGKALCFNVLDGRDMGCFGDRLFNWAVCRGLEGTWRTVKGNREWNKMRNEMLRVAGRVLLIDYNRGHKILKREDYL